MRFVIWALYNATVDFKLNNQYAESAEFQLVINNLSLLYHIIQQQFSN